MTTASSDGTSAPAAEIDRRFLALAVDRLLGWGLMAGIGVASWFLLIDAGQAALGWIVVVLGVLLVGLLFAVLTGLRGLTPGKALLGLRVVHHGTGTPIGIGPAIMRSLIVAAGTVPLGFGLVTLGWTVVTDPGRQRRGFHDVIASSVVLDVRPRAIEEEPDADDGPRHVVNLTAMRLRPAPVTAPPSRPAAPAGQSGQRPGATDPVPAASATVRPPAQQPVQRPPAPQQSPAPQQPGGRRPLEQRPPASPQPGLAGAPGPQRPEQQGRRRRDVPEDTAPPRAPQAPPAPQRPSVDGDSTRAGKAMTRWRVTFDSGESFVVAGLGLVGRKPDARPGEQVAHLVPLQSTDMSLSKTHAQFHLSPEGSLVVMGRG